MVYNHVLKRIIFFLLFLLVACNSKPDESEVNSEDRAIDDQPKLDYDTSAVAIILLDSSRHILADRAISPAIITQQELSVVDSLVMAFVTNHNAGIKKGQDLDRIDLRQANYRMQLVAFVNSKNEKEVWVNGFCRGGDQYWKVQPVVVFDGGSCYFQLIINLQKKSYDPLVNGRA